MRAVRQNNDPEKLRAATTRMLQGEIATVAAQNSGIRYKTLVTNVRTLRRGEDIVPRRRGPQRLFPPEAEQHIVEWLIGMQMIGFPVPPSDIVAKANEVSARIARRDIGYGWYQRFLSRHHELTGRVAQNISRCRNGVSKDYITVLLWTMVKAIVENGLDATRVYNVDETAFLSRVKSRRVVAVRSSPNVWSKTVATSFHLTIVACASAAEHVIPPTCLLPGERVRKETLDQCAVQDAVVTTTQFGFINAPTFEKWLRWFANKVPADVALPIVLVMDGYRCHYSLEMVEVASSVGVLLVYLPANATHLLQPVDVSVFSALKKQIRRLVQAYMLASGVISISKPEAIRIGREAWISCNFSNNIVAGFKITGLFPLSRVNVELRFDRFKRNGVTSGIAMAKWLKCKTVVEEDVLTLPAPTKGKRKRKTVDVAGRLLTMEMVHEATNNPPARRPRTT